MIKCSTCSREFKSDVGMRKHKCPPLKQEGPLFCLLCGWSFGFQVEKNHLKSAHGITSSEYGTQFPNTPLRVLKSSHKEGIKKRVEEGSYFVPTGWNKGQTAETNEALARAVETRIRRHKSGEIKLGGNKHTPESIAKLKLNGGGYRHGAGRGKHCFYDSPIAGHVSLDSSWELEIAKLLDAWQVRWEKIETVKATWTDKDGKERRYVPDFWLPEYNLYLEPKGYLTSVASLKLNQVKLKIRVAVLTQKRYDETISCLSLSQAIPLWESWADSKDLV